jgi:hypothetical protein
MKNIVIIIILFSLCINFSGCIENQDDDYLKHIVIIKEEYNHRTDWLKIKEVTGVVENNGNLSLNKVTFKVSFYNENNFLLNEKYAYINNLQPFQNKSFRVVYENYEKFYDEISFYKIDISEYVLDKY